MFPEYVIGRLKKVYSYLGMSLVLTSASATTAFNIRCIREFINRQDLTATALNLIATIGSGILAHAVNYEEGFGKKQLFWLLHIAVMGATVSPVWFLEKQFFVKIMVYSGVMLSVLLATAFLVPKDQFLQLDGPLAMGSDIVFCASLGRIFLSPSSFFGTCFCFLSVYGSIALFSAYTLYDSQKIINNAELYPIQVIQEENPRPYDPINASLTLYTDSLNIFIRIATYVAGAACGEDIEGFDMTIGRGFGS